MKSRALAFLAPLFLLTVSACGGSNTQKVDANGAFTFTAPGDLVAIETFAFDAVVGEMASAEMKLSYNFGPNAPAPTGPGATSSKLSLLFVDGHEATIRYFEDRGGSAQYPYVAMLHVPQGPEGNRLTMFLRCSEGECIDEARTLFRSISFSKGGSTSIAQLPPAQSSGNGNSVSPEGDAAQ